MGLQSTQFITVDSDGINRLIAYQRDAATRKELPGLIWLNGFTSTMMSTKVTALAGWCAARGLGLTRFDHLGHGESTGEMTAGTISRWLADATAVFDQLTEGPQILVGSSMGGWLAMLLLRQHLAELAPEQESRIKGLMMIAPALDLTEDLIWQKMDETARRRLLDEGFIIRPEQHGGSPMPITREFIEDGRRHLLGNAGFAPRCPVRVLQGRSDEIVPWQHALRVMDVLEENDCEFLLIKDGDHRLSRPSDIVRLTETINGILLAQSGHPETFRHALF